MASESMAKAVTESLELMKLTLANSPSEISPQLVNVWATVLEAAGLSPDDVRRAATVVISRERFFPQPAVIIEAIRPKINDDLLAEAAWQTAVDAVRAIGGYGSLIPADVKGDPRILWALERIGWDRLCRELGDENRQFFRAEFVRLFRLAASERAETRYIPGRCERENVARGIELTPALCGRGDWREMPEERTALPECDEGAVPIGQLLAALPAGGE